MTVSRWLDVPFFEVLRALPGDRVALEAAVRRADPEALVRLAMRHGVSAWLAEGLEATGLKLPGKHQAELARDAQRLVGLALRHRRLLRATLPALAQEGVEVLCLKGLALAQRLYPQPLVRPSSDVDVLVRPGDLDAARRALARLDLLEQHDEGLADVFEEHHHVGFAGPLGLVEVHFRLFSGFGRGAFDGEGLWARSRAATVEGHPARLLGAEDEFLYLAVHAANHGFLRASWLVDLQRYLVTQPPLDGAALLARAEAAGFARAYAGALHALEASLGVQPPGVARRGVRGRVDALVFCPLVLATGRLGEDPALSFLARLWLVDGPRNGLRHLTDGAQRWRRRKSRETSG